MSTSSSSWSNLIEELLESIFNRFEDSRDIFRCGFVCVSWRAVALKMSSKLIPCLSSPGWGKTHTVLNVKKMQTQQIPDYCLYTACSTNYGWLLQFTDAYGIHLLNIFSKAKVTLPPTCKVIDKVATSTCPLNPECLVLVAYWSDNKHKYAFCKVGDENWTTLDRSYFVTDLHNSSVSVTWYKGKFYGIDADKRLFVFNLSLRTIELFCEEPLIIGFKNYEIYLVESLFGELLLVSGNQALWNAFKMYKFDFITKKWYEVESVRNQALFLCRDGSAQVYMAKRSCIIHSMYRKEGYRVVVYDMETKSAEVIPKTTSAVEDCSVLEALSQMNLGRVNLIPISFLIEVGLLQDSRISFSVRLHGVTAAASSAPEKTNNYY
ncbi:putative F-box protein At5g55150 [Tripterygium wilfordii]|uniref:putative F-box protein At5g55150 n=1 Tax=Tripterygium wilfordii TaxID=458696 RepID=UPI0018F855E4|nr:putative F-box protein At5g55150 [Tripterygium wilfordii]